MLSQRYERGSTMLTSNLPVAEWTEVLGSERLTGALLDHKWFSFTLPRWSTFTPPVTFSEDDSDADVQRVCGSGGWDE